MYYMYVYTGKGLLGVTQDFKTGVLKVSPVDATGTAPTLASRQLFSNSTCP